MSIVFLLCFIFILGCAAGWFGNCVYRGAKTAGTAAFQEEYELKKDTDGDDDKDVELRQIIVDLVRDLRLDAGQQVSLENIFYETRLKYQKLNNEFNPRYKMIRDESDDEIRGILRDDQRKRFEEILKPYRRQKTAAVDMKPPFFLPANFHPYCVPNGTRVIG